MKIKVNENYKNLSDNYLFSEIAKRVNSYCSDNPKKAKDVIRLGIGDVTLPLPKICVKALKKAAREMGNIKTFRGYPPEHGQKFLREAVAKHYFSFGVNISYNEVFISDGAKSDSGNIVDILGDNTINIPDPVYPVYFDTNVMSGRNIQLMSSNIENSFLPMPNEIKKQGEPSVIYLCSPNNPTGAVYNSEQLRIWVDYALKTGSFIIFDSAYEAFIRGDYPHSIFAIEGAKKCAVEISSLSKTASFTGTRCGYSVFPTQLNTAGDMNLQSMWARRQATKFNGVSYPVQRAAEAALSAEGMVQCQKNIDYYLENAHLIAELFSSKGIKFTGGSDSPYIWLQCPNGLGSWEFFDMLLEKIQVVGTPGEGFGECGKGYFRLSSFGSREATIEAVSRLDKLL